jgi:hypothetical protein
MRKVADWPCVSVPAAHVNVEPDDVQPGALTELAAAGSVSETTTFVAVPAVAVTWIVYVTTWPAAIVEGEPVLVMVRLGAATTVVAVAGPAGAALVDVAVARLVNVPGDA